MVNRQLHEVYKAHEREWKVQCPKGVLTFKTKREAESYAKKAKEVFCS